MSLGLLEAGFDVRLAVEIDPFAVETYRRNIGDHCLQTDIRNVDGRKLLASIGLKELDVLSGGPPCQGFSKQKRGAHLGADERNDLVREYARLVGEVRPRAFIFENVQIFGQKRGRELIDYIEESLPSYRIHRFFVSAAEFGLAQRRGRFLMIGIRRDVSEAVPVLGRVSKIATVRQAIGDLPPPPDDFTEHPRIANHIKCRITPLNEERFRHVPPGGGWPDIPASLRLDCHNGVDATKGGWPDVYGRLEWDGQAPTITAGFDSFTRGRYGHPEQHRSLTLREGARLQGFPDRFRFYGTRYDVRLQIGNAVPPPLAKAVGEAIRRVLEGSTNVPALPQYPENTIPELMAAE
uniref:DNA (cytosine-5-)-methyltransferase n=1 Tax=Bosea sp. NBC_00436 TaxID=2969620 RepID=A0A9E8CMC0_9HYPH